MIIDKLRDNSKECVGCGNCINSCENSALKKSYDICGFITVDYDPSKCVSCGKCVDVCPQFDYCSDNTQRPECYAVAAPEILRDKSTAGGAFSVLAQQILEDNGYVCGVKMNGQNAEYVLIHSVKEIDDILGAKYIEADPKNIFSDVKELLNKGEKVLFCGTPCHVQALYKFVGTEHENLVTVDFVCHGVSSPTFFKMLSQEYDKEENPIVRFDFTPKKYGFRPDISELIFKDGTAKIDKCFSSLHNSCVSLRKSCYNCQFAPLPRNSDITLGIFYGIERINPKANNAKGISMALLNSGKGRALIMKSKKNFDSFEKVPVKFAIDNNRFFKDYIENPKRDRLIDMIKSSAPFADIKYYIEDDKYDAAIVSNWSSYNYGAHLTHYALYNVLSDQGFKVLMVEKPDVDPWRPTRLPELFRKNPYPSYALSPLYRSMEDMKHLNSISDTFIVSSDQVWNYSLFGHAYDFYTLSFVDEDKQRFSFATSFGSRLNFPDTKIKGNFHERISKFSFISLADEKGVEICKNEFGIRSQYVLDPVFLASKETFDALAAKSKCRKISDYVFVDINRPRKKTEDLILDFCESRKSEYICVKNPCISVNELKQICSLSTVNCFVEDWLWYIINSSYVLVDSFHALCFAIIYKKDFNVFIEKDKEGYESMLSLIKKLDLEDRVIYDISSQYDENGRIGKDAFSKIDYNSVYEKLEPMIAESRQWLNNAMNNSISKTEE